MHRIRIEHFTKLREIQASIDEIVLEIFINQESSKGMVDISDSRGYSFFKDKEIKFAMKIFVIRKNECMIKEYY